MLRSIPITGGNRIIAMNIVFCTSGSFGKMTTEPKNFGHWQDNASQQRYEDAVSVH